MRKNNENVADNESEVSKMHTISSFIILVTLTTIIVYTTLAFILIKLIFDFIGVLSNKLYEE